MRRPTSRSLIQRRMPASRAVTLWWAKEIVKTARRYRTIEV